MPANKALYQLDLESLLNDDDEMGRQRIQHRLNTRHDYEGRNPAHEDRRRRDAIARRSDKHSVNRV